MNRPSSVQVLGLGRAERGDDGVGHAVVRRLRERGVAADWVPDATALVERLDGTPTVIVDAVLAEPPGRVLELSVHELSGAPAVSSHALSVPAAVELAAVLSGPTPVWLVGVAIRAPGPGGTGLSPAVAAAVEPAADRVLRLVEAQSHA